MVVKNDEAERKTNMKSVIKTSKRGIIVILTLCILLCTNGIGVHAISMPEENIAVIEEITVVVEETTDTIETIAPELMPMMARGCEPTTIYVNSSINIRGNEPNATYVYCSGGGGPISGGVALGTIYSIAQMDSFGNTIWRRDLRHHRAIRAWHTCLRLFRHTSQKSLPVALLQPANFCIV